MSAGFVMLLEGDDLHYLVNLGCTPTLRSAAPGGHFGVDIHGGSVDFEADGERFVLVMEDGSLLTHRDAWNVINSEDDSSSDLAFPADWLPY